LQVLCCPKYKGLQVVHRIASTWLILARTVYWPHYSS